MNTYGYVGGNPISYVDPVGLLRWSGSFDSKAVTAPVGAGVADFTLKSKCIDGKQATVEVVGIGPALGAGLKLSGSKGSIEFEDHKDSIQPNVFNGTFGTIGASFQIGKFGGSIGKIRLGSAFSRGSSNVKGIDVGVSTVMGSSTVLDVKYKVCSCE